MSAEPSKLILIRHGMAKKALCETDDKDRELTKKGRKELEKMSIELNADIQADLKAKKNLYIWSSPILRAQQTAEIIAKAIGNIEITRCRCIEIGDFDEFQKKVAELQLPFCLIIVGHEPYLSAWSEKISGTAISYKKGMAVGFQIQLQDPLRANPRWILQPESVAVSKSDRLRNQPALEVYQKILLSKLYEIFQMQNQFIAFSDDMEVNHKLRIKIREFRSIMSFIKPLLKQEEYVEIQKHLKKMGQIFAALREIDSLIEGWSKIIQIHPEFHILMEKLESAREKERSVVCGEVMGGAMSKVLFSMHFKLNQGLEPENPWENITFEEFTMQRLERWMKKANSSLKKTEFANLKSIHATRIRIKKLRYITEILKPYMNFRRNKKAENWSTLQDGLGLICDVKRNAEVLKKLTNQYKNTSIKYECGILEGYLMRAADQKICEIRRQKIFPVRDKAGIKQG